MPSKSVEGLQVAISVSRKLGPGANARITWNILKRQRRRPRRSAPCGIELLPIATRNLSAGALSASKISVSGLPRSERNRMLAERAQPLHLLAHAVSRRGPPAIARQHLRWRLRPRSSMASASPRRVFVGRRLYLHSRAPDSSPAHPVGEPSPQRRKANRAFPRNALLHGCRGSARGPQVSESAELSTRVAINFQLCLDIFQENRENGQDCELGFPNGFPD